MADRYQQFSESAPGRFMVRRLGLPQPAELQRGPGFIEGPMLVEGDVRLPAGVETHERASDGVRYAALVFDARRLTHASDLRRVYEFFQPTIRSLAPSGRLIVIGSGDGIA